MAGQSRRASLFCANAGDERSNIVVAILYIIFSQKSFCSTTTDADATSSLPAPIASTHNFRERRVASNSASSVKSSNVSNIDQRLPLLSRKVDDRYTAAITAPFRHSSVKESSAALPPDLMRGIYARSTNAHFVAIVALRTFALFSNVLFILYGLLAHIYPAWRSIENPSSGR
jgi:hypothetical protein